jgi:hypothetical protein
VVGPSAARRSGDRDNPVTAFWETLKRNKEFMQLVLAENQKKFEQLRPTLEAPRRVAG